MGTNNVVFREYIKDIFPYFNGNGTVLHTVSAVCRNPNTTAIQHSFGNDECLNEYVRLGPLAEANKILGENIKQIKNTEYMFTLISVDTLKKEFKVKELEDRYQEKNFKILWKKTFGNKRKVSYSWGWSNNVMFSTYPLPEGQQSMVKVDYPTEKLVFRIHFPDMYPLEGKPFVVMVDKYGKEIIKVDVIETKQVVGVILPKLNCKEVKRSFCASINNPIPGKMYKICWLIGIENVSKYLAWLESRI